MNIPDHPDRTVMCTDCISKHTKMVVFRGNPYKFKCPVCNGQDCTDVKVALDYLYTKDLGKYSKMVSLLQIIGVWGKELKEGYYN